MRVCNEGFDQDFIDGKSDMYAIAFTQNVLSGRWKYFILWYLKNETRRYTDIKKFLGDLSQGSLTKQLKELENDGVIQRDVFRKFLHGSVLINRQGNQITSDS